MIPGKRKSNQKFHRKPDQNNYFLYRPNIHSKNEVNSFVFLFTTGQQCKMREWEELKDNKNQIACLIITFIGIGRKMVIISGINFLVVN